MRVLGRMWNWTLHRRGAAGQGRGSGYCPCSGRRGSVRCGDQFRAPNKAITSTRVHGGLEPAPAFGGDVRDVYAAGNADAGFDAGLEGCSDNRGL